MSLTRTDPVMNRERKRSHIIRLRRDAVADSARRTRSLTCPASGVAVVVACDDRVVARMQESAVAAVSDAARYGGRHLDDDQLRLVRRLDDIDVATRRRRGAGFRGLYVWGSAGRGKSWLCDQFFDAAPTTSKVRVHFHSFFDELHRQVHAHRDDSSTLQRALDDVLGDGRLVLFDEFHVHDAGDARLLTRLLEVLVARNVSVLATSNYAPDDLLPNPIWHHIFEPGIELITTHFDVHHLGGDRDYRQTGRPDAARGFASGTWTVTSPAWSHGGPDDGAVLSVGNRQFPVLEAREDQLLASFDQLCRYPVSTIEYLRWARTHPRWTIVDIPRLDHVDPEAQQRFINLIDVLVDSDIPVAFRSEHTLDAFLDSVSARPDAFRTKSRMRLIWTAH